ncbi:MAG: cell wall-binding repeat-containing protein [Acidimicrobiales bacterium]
MKTLTRLRPRLPWKALAAAALAVVTTGGAAIGLAGVAAAALPVSDPVSSGLPPTPGTIGLLPGGLPTNVSAGQSNAGGQGWFFNLASTWTTGDVLAIPIFPDNVVAAVNNVSSGDWVSFAAAPTLFCNTSTPNVTAPTFTTTLATNPNDPVGDAGLKDVVELTFTNSAPNNGTTFTQNASFSCLNVGPTNAELSLNIGPNVPSGAIQTSISATDTATYSSGTTPPPPATAGFPVQGTTPTSFALTVASPATVTPVAGLAVAANNPAVSVQPSAQNASISNITLTEAHVGQVPTGCIVVTMNDPTGNTVPYGFTTTSTTPTLTVIPSNTGGAGTVTPNVTPTGSLSGLAPFPTIFGDVTAASTNIASTYTFGGLTVDAPNAVGPVTATIVVGGAFGAGPPATCTGGTTVTTTLQIFAVGQQTLNTRIAGVDSDGTAVAALEYQYPPEPGFCLPRGTNPNPSRFATGASVVLATDTTWQDALTASYLASYLQTGVLLTPTGTLSAETAQAIQNEGVSTVYIVGGPLAVSSGVASQLSSTPAYQCGGAAPQLNALGAPIDLNVQRIWGATADDTAQDVATYVASGFVGSMNLAGASGMYNDTTGTSSGSLSTVPVRTAILVTDNSYQDAASASGLAYSYDLPILLTNSAVLSPQAEAGLLQLGIQQVIEMGGPLAISNAVNSGLAAQGISVLRIAGQDATDTSVQLADFELNSYSTSTGLAEGLGWAVGSNFTTAPAPGCPTSGQVAPYSAFNSLTGCNSVVGIARSDFYADALTSSVVTGGGSFRAQHRHQFPLILTENPTTLGQYSTGFLNAAGSQYGIEPTGITPLTPSAHTGVSVTSLTVFGGPLAVAQSTVQAALAAISQG